MIQIEKGIPAPPTYKYPHKEMEVGDSFYVRTFDDPNVERAIRAASYRVSAGHKFVTRRETDSEGYTGIRTWRIA